MSSLLEPAASKFDTLPSIATLDGRPILSTGPQDSLDSMTEKRVDFALTTLVDRDIGFAIERDRQGGRFEGLCLDRESEEEKYRKVNIGQTHEVHLHTVEFAEGLPRLQLILLIFDVMEGDYITGRWAVDLSEWRDVAEVQVTAIFNWASRFCDSLEDMKGALDRLCTHEGKTWREFLLEEVQIKSNSH
ncbi:hypothetical protein NliqN6_5977 [Naganishia liquefaciens]|uniref:Uncharacterized protein n=1 Tax=Naganishia liquefaciens TaxID=104408 RepID=A0A8H3YH48_9TREE|nr:hypothetical protein NliqN6_5977 [Naganishia liquefaciens]